MNDIGIAVLEGSFKRRFEPSSERLVAEQRSVAFLSHGTAFTGIDI